MIARRMFVTLMAGWLAACTTPDSETDTVSAVKAKPTHIIYVVRHAEKQTGEDPDLTMDGKARAEGLTGYVGDVDYAWSTPYRRTQQTVQPAADKAGIPVTIYNPRDPDGLVSTIQSNPGTHVIAGHSNTVQGLVTALGGTDPAPEPIVEATEYDRLYTIIYFDDGTVKTSLTRY